jgi:hypothetical protein
MYRKRIAAALLMGVCGLAAFAGGSKDRESPRSAGLDGTVWAAPFGAADWITLAFRAGDGNHGQDAVIQSAAPVNGDIAPVEYSYDTAARTGSIPGGGSGEPPGAFSLDEGGTTITFADFRGSGSPLVFKRLLPDAGSSFVLLDPLPANLENTVWVSKGFRVNDWITIIFTNIDGSGSVEFAHVADNSQYTRTYTYDGAQKTGGISYVARDFVIGDNNATLQLRGFYGHEVPVDFKRVR